MEHDPNKEAHRLVRESTRQEGELLPPDIEAHWFLWIKGIQGVDERVRTLLRAAFEAGVDAAKGRGL